MGAYDDIINLQHPTSTKHPRMPMIDRAAQFSPFQALSGYGAAIQETARLTDQRVELTEEEKMLLDTGATGRITYFQPDEKKEGGAYAVIEGIVKKIDPLERCICLMSRVKLPIDDILDVEI